MRRIFIILLVLILSACSINTSPGTEEDNKPNPVSTIPKNNSGEYIIVGRSGNEKGVYAIDTETSQIHREIYVGDYIALNALKDRVLIYRNENTKEVGEFIIKDLSGNTLKTIGTAWSVLEKSKPIFRPDGKGIVYIGASKKLYYVDIETEEVKEINSVKGDIKYLHFIDDDTVIYSKLLRDDKNNKEHYQIFEFSLKSFSEKQLVVSNYNDLSPVMSGDKTKLAFLRYDSGKYLPYIRNMSDSEEKCIYREEGVVGDSLKWSKSQKYLTFIIEKGGAERVKLYKFESSFLSDLSRAYSSIFSPDGESVAYVEYTEVTNGDKVEMLQQVYTKNLKDKEPQRVFEVSENASYSKSLEILLWFNGEIP